jgi:beta-glucosidase
MPSSLPYKNPALPIEDRITDLLARMTLEEKAGQMNQWFNLTEQHDDMVRRGEIGSDLLANSSTAGNDRQERVFARAVNAIQRVAVEESRLGIPIIFGRDVIHGYRTMAPIPLGMAAAWSPELTEGAYAIAAQEARADGVQWAFSPMLDIARDPRWGRIAEGFGEDPFLAGKLAAAAVRGAQGGVNLATRTGEVHQQQSTISQHYVAACAKHYAGYGAVEGGRDYNSTEISRHTLQNVYLPPFKAAVEAGIASVMSAFHTIGGLPTSANHYLLTEVLRQQWGFEGFVVTDWAAVKEMIAHGVAADEAEAAALAANAGVDMDMNTLIYLKNIPALVRAGKVPEAGIDEHVRRILRVKFALGLFENPYADPEAAQKTHMLPESQAHMRKLAAQTMVLLKNNGVLPLQKEQISVGLTGPLAVQRGALFGCWTLDGQEEDVTTVKEALESKLGAGARMHHVELWDDALKLARWCDVMVLALGESAGRSGEDNCTATIDLPPGQEELVEAMHRTGVPVVAVIFAGRPLNLTRLADWADAIVYAWHPGVTGGLGVADVLFGDVNPSGRLPVSFPRSTGHIPAHYNHLPTGRPLPPNDRRHSRYNDALDSALFPFGFGLSYSLFEYSNIRITKQQSQQMIVSAEVKNTSQVAGETVVQCYIRDCVASISRPVRELKGFERVALQPGESKTVTFSLGPSELCFLGEDGQPILEPGRFQVWVGGDSNAPLNTEFEI